MHEILSKLLDSKKQISITFSAAVEGKLASISGIIIQVGDDYLVINDIYGNSMLVPQISIAYIEIKK